MVLTVETGGGKLESICPLPGAGDNGLCLVAVTADAARVFISSSGTRGGMMIDLSVEIEQNGRWESVADDFIVKKSLIRSRGVPMVGQR